MGGKLWSVERGAGGGDICAPVSALFDPFCGGRRAAHACMWKGISCNQYAYSTCKPQAVAMLHGPGTNPEQQVNQGTTSSLTDAFLDLRADHLCMDDIQTLASARRTG